MMRHGRPHAALCLLIVMLQAISKHVDPDSAAASLSADDAADPSAFEGLADLVEDLLEDVDSFLQDDNGAIAQVGE